MNRLNRYEKLLVEAEKHGVESIEMPFGENCGYYCDNVTFINRSSTNAYKHGILGEELGHHFTSAGDVLDQSNPSNIKQERKARTWGFEHTVPLTRLAEAIDYPCTTMTELTEYLELPKELLLDAIEYYRQKYGLYATVNNYTIWFEPLRIIKMFE